MGDFSRDPEVVLQDAIAKDCARVRFQPGKPLLDRELDLLADIANNVEIKLTVRALRLAEN